MSAPAHCTWVLYCICPSNCFLITLLFMSDRKIPLIINTVLVRVRMRYDTYLFCKTSTYFSPCSSWCSAGHRTLTVKKATLFYCRWNWIHPLNLIANSVPISISISSLLMQVEALPILAKRAGGVEAKSTTAKRSRFSLLILIPWHRA
jgi:hypothetical protein